MYIQLTLLISTSLISNNRLSRSENLAPENLTTCLFVCVEVLRPSQPNGVMSSVVSLPNHTFTGQT